MTAGKVGHKVHSFFFSSRRRHTRYWRDWSSDVCSSDLGPTRRRPAVRPIAERTKTIVSPWMTATSGVGTPTRSEERRVGKECRARRAPSPYKKDQSHARRRQVESDAQDTVTHDQHTGTK